MDSDEVVSEQVVQRQGHARVISAVLLVALVGLGVATSMLYSALNTAKSERNESAKRVEELQQDLSDLRASRLEARRPVQVTVGGMYQLENLPPDVATLTAAVLLTNDDADPVWVVVDGDAEAGTSLTLMAGRCLEDGRSRTTFGWGLDYADEDDKLRIVAQRLSLDPNPSTIDPLDGSVWVQILVDGSSVAVLRGPLSDATALPGQPDPCSP